MRPFLRSASLLALVGAAAFSNAVSLVYSIRSTASGTLNGVSFTNALVTLTGTADSSSVVGSAPFYRVPVVAKVSVQGVGDDVLTQSAVVFSTQLTQTVGFGTAPNPLDILDSRSPAFATYDLRTPLAATTGTSVYYPAVSFSTSRGSFRITSSGDSTFSAAPVPEPASMIALGLGAVALVRRRAVRK